MANLSKVGTLHGKISPTDQGLIGFLSPKPGLYGSLSNTVTGSSSAKCPCEEMFDDYPDYIYLPSPIKDSNGRYILDSNGEKICGRVLYMKVKSGGE